MSLLNRKKDDKSFLNDKKKIENDSIISELNYKQYNKEMEERLNDIKTAEKRKEIFNEIKSRNKKILEELSISLTTPESNSPNINLSEQKTDNKAFKILLSSQGKSFLPNDISIKETVDTLLSTPLNSHFENNKELLIKSKYNLYKYNYIYKYY